MSCLIFDGKAFAKHKELYLKREVDRLSAQGKRLHVKTFTFIEDEGSRLYTKLKQAAAQRVGIRYEPIEFSLSDDLGTIIQSIREASFDSHLTGIMIQKPSKATWQEANRNKPVSFQTWWESLANAIDPKKDVDCLTHTNLERIANSQQPIEQTLLPATVKACISILAEAKKSLSVSDDEWKKKRVVVLGRSDIVGKPLSVVLRNHGLEVRNMGKEDLDNLQNNLTSYDIIISATGVSNLVTGQMIKDGVIAIDVGAPSGDIERESVEPKASFLTPVPGGVGPVTIVSLLENVITLAAHEGRQGS